MTVAILAKAPAPGLAKTRLIPALGAHGAAFVAERMIERAVETACAAGIGRVTLWASPDTTHAVFRELATRFPIALARQGAGDLGARMLAALSDGPTICIGSDCPMLGVEHLRDAAAALRDGVDVVVVPAEDGGYVMIGSRTPQPALFTDMTWSADTVMKETRRRLAHAGLTWRELAPLWDVDRPEDLERLAAHGMTELIE